MATADRRRPPWSAGLAVLAGLVAFALAWDVIGRPHRDAFEALPEAARALGAAVVLFAVCGFGAVRLLLPEALREREVLWVLPTGACLAGLGMTALGFLAVPFTVSLWLVLAGGAALSAVALRRAGVPRLRWREAMWPAWLGALVVGLALTPMFDLGEAVPTGTGSDAHLAAGTGQLLQHAYPTGRADEQPVDRMPVRWGSKFPIYYALAGVSRLAGLRTYEVLASLAALLLALAAVGMYLVARELLGLPPPAAAATMALTALIPVVLQTGLNPYFNQTWGWFALPFSLVLAWHVARPEGRSAGTAVLLGAFLAVLVLAYPLALPIPLIPLAIFLVRERPGLPRLGALARDRSRRPWLILGGLLVVAALAVPAAGVWEKSWAAAGVVLDPHHSLRSWGGDLRYYIPLSHFFALPSGTPFALGVVAVAGLICLAALGLRDRPGPLAWGLGAVIAFGLLLGLYFRHREFGWYFQFKLLAFSTPLLLACAVAGALRLRRAGPAIVALMLAAAIVAGHRQLDDTGYQLDHTTVALAGWARELPPGASVRLDMPPGQQLWAAYFLARQPLCSELPLLQTDYPHVRTGRRADYIVAATSGPRPADAVGAALRSNPTYDLFRADPHLPGPDLCSRRMVQPTDPPG